MTTIQERAFAQIKISSNGTKTIKKIEEIIPQFKHSLSYSPSSINVCNTQYAFNYPLRCLFEKEDNYYTIHNEQIDVIGTGQTQQEAENNFNEEFHYLYNKLNSLDDTKLNNRLVRIKSVINSFVKEII